MALWNNQLVGVNFRNSFKSRCYRQIFFIASFCSTTLLFFIISKPKFILHRHVPYGIKSFDAEIYTIRTPGCSIPAMKPLDESIKKYVEYPLDLPRCRDPALLPLGHNQTHIWIKQHFREKMRNNTLICCYQSFFRPVFIENINNNVDSRVKYDKCKEFSDIIDVNHENIRVNCSVGNTSTSQYFLFATKKKFMSHDNKKELAENVPAYNILVLGIDSVSRLNFYRTMPKTLNYLKKKGVVDLAGYNKVGDNSFPNLIPMLLGISPDELKRTCLPYRQARFDNCPFIWEWFKQAGFYTALGEDSSWLGTFNYLRGGFSSTPTDYYLHTFIHQAELFARHHSNSTYLCLNDKYFYKVLLDYVQNLAITLKRNRLFGFFWEITMTHNYLNYPMVMDDDYVNFLQSLEKIDYLNNSIIFLVSDHGMRWGRIRLTKQGRLEERLPFAFILVPPSFRHYYRKAFKHLKLNSNRLTTPYDVHATLLDLINLENINNKNISVRTKSFYSNKRSISLFLPIPSNRTCEMANISDHWCTCYRSTPLSENSPEAVVAASHLLGYLNSFTKQLSSCAKLTLAYIVDITEMRAGKADLKESAGWREFQLTIKTLPGGGVFEATLRNSSLGDWSLSGTISRLNLYGSQSKCVNDNLLKLYCYCIE